jgi:hypothetical protein
VAEFDGGTDPVIVKIGVTMPATTAPLFGEQNPAEQPLNCAAAESGRNKKSASSNRFM